MKNRNKLMGDLYNFYQVVNGCDAPVAKISMWQTMHTPRLEIEHQKLKEVHDTKILSSKKQ